eukprot:16446535-Heterocapsa_arctica.AAC.1
MRRRDSADRVIAEVQEQVRHGIDVIIWAAIPCTPWCRWQTVNAAHSPEAAQRIAQARAESQGMMQQLIYVLNR